MVWPSLLDSGTSFFFKVQVVNNSRRKVAFSVKSLEKQGFMYLLTCLKNADNVIKHLLIPFN